MDIFSYRLKKLRLKKKLSQDELAQKIGVDQKTISNWEKGAIEPNITAAKNLSEILEVPILYLFGLDWDTKEAFKIMRHDLTKSKITTPAGQELMKNIFDIEPPIAKEILPICPKCHTDKNTTRVDPFGSFICMDCGEEFEMKQAENAKELKAQFKRLYPDDGF